MAQISPEDQKLLDDIYGTPQNAVASPAPTTGPYWDTVHEQIKSFDDSKLYEEDPEAAALLNKIYGAPPPNSTPTPKYLMDHDVPTENVPPQDIHQLLALYGAPPPGSNLTLGDHADMNDTMKTVEQIEQEREPTGIFSGVIDVISRFQYAEAAAFDELASGENVISAVGNAMVRGVQEFFVPKSRLSFVDMIEKYMPETAEKYPVATMIAGVGLDTALDPTTWLTLGVGGAGKAFKIASKTGETLYLTQKGAAKLKKLTKISQRYIADELITDSARMMWAEEKMAIWAMKEPEKFLFKKGAQAHFTTPISGKHIATLMKPEQAKAFADFTGLTAIQNAVKTYTDKSVLLQSIGGTFRRVGELPPKYLALANEFLHQAESAHEIIVKATAKMGKGLTKEGALKIGRAAHGISDELMELGKQTHEARKLGRGGATVYSEPVDITDPLVIERVQKKWFKKEGLGEKEVNVYSEMRRGFAEMRSAELQVGLHIKEIAEYFPRYYDNVIKGVDDTGQFYKAKRFTTRLKAMKSRVFDTVKEAEDAGLNPEWNAVKVFTHRAIASRKAIAKKNFDDALNKLIKTEKFDKKTQARILRDARQIGDSSHPNFEYEWMNAMVNASDYVINAVFRPTATVLKPGFATFQALSNTVQMIWAGGFKMGARAGVGVAKNVVDNVGSGFGGKYWESMRKTLFNIDPNAPRMDSALLLKYIDEPEKLRGSIIRTDLGLEYTGEEVIQMIKNMRIAQGTSVLGVPGFKTSAMTEIRRQNAVAWVADKTGVGEGFVDFASGAAAYWNWPRMVEDMARTNFFMTALRQGHSPHEAMRLVNKALYDYTGGLSKFERMWVKRIMPFYSFTRFTLPLAADVATTKPGRLLNTTRGMKMFFGAWNKIQGGEQLNDTERHAIPGWILEQASTFGKFGMDGRAHFNAFTNWTPLDAVNFLEHGDKERSAFERTVQKSILSMLTPVIKLPLEHVMNQNFFTGRTLKDIYRQKDRLGTDSTLWQAADTVLPGPIKKMMSWEMGTDIRTGKTNVYINPYITHYMTGVAPVLNQFIRVMDGDLTIREKAMWTLANVSTYKIDMQDQYKRLKNARKAQVAEKKRQIKDLRKRGLDGSAEEHMHELKQLYMDIRADAAEETEKPRGVRNPPGG
jgi:hypothetical protein